ncbi:hypothetical protein SAMN05443244_0971 [Terriglobus roseus]|uniref:Uncharacterized protein n=1 Tax=Terriglobus roseus TaxID=392734 RepID=A0A1H4K4D9_9BACT|nr:hypothetical protein SAMN05443244_0971 [Terriglobus roseus]
MSVRSSVGDMGVRAVMCSGLCLSARPLEQVPPNVWSIDSTDSATCRCVVPSIYPVTAGPFIQERWERVGST